MKAVMFRHNQNGLGTFPGLFEKAGFEVQIIDTWRDDLSGSFDALAPDLLVVMGGAPGAYQANDYPFLQQEIEILQKRLAANKPTLGICLGAQLISKAMGANNYKGTQGPEVGWYPLELTPAGRKSPVRHLAPEFTYVAESHQDTFDLPEGVELLASTKQYPHQAFSRGNMLALQFHPEVDEVGCKSWFVSYAGMVASGQIDLPRWRSETAHYLPKMIQQTEKMIYDWLADVGLRAEQESRRKLPGLKP
jgi:GMP synthase (glutamine-hydrolysing)